MQHGDGDARHQQIDDENSLGDGVVDAAEGKAVEGKAARQRKRRDLALVLAAQPIAGSKALVSKGRMARSYGARATR